MVRVLRASSVYQLSNLIERLGVKNYVPSPAGIQAIAGEFVCIMVKK